MAPPTLDNGEETDVGAIEGALEHLFRLNASRKVHQRRAAAAGVAISQPGFQLLRRIHEEDGLHIGALARLTEMDPAATGRQITQLEADGLVTRQRHSDDGRAVVVKVTPAGAEVRRRLSLVAERHMADVLAGWTAADRRRFAALLPRFVEGLRQVPYRNDEADHAGRVRSA
ncbi:MAG: MarR family winged helix-turn-helix transcriptional regulator [Acidimicrobiales bacterium]